jgi:hypothetical protein
MCDELLRVQRIVVTRYAVMHVGGVRISNPELELATAPQELITAILTAFHRCTQPIDELVAMLGFVRDVRFIANLPLR